MFGFNIIKRYCEQNADLFKTVRNLMYKQMNGRLADTLLYIENLKNENSEIFQLFHEKILRILPGFPPKVR